MKVTELNFEAEPPTPHVDVFLEEVIGVPADFFITLNKDDDWAFAIKLHALIEASLNHLLVKRLGDDRLGRVVARLDTGGQTGKLAFVKTLGLLEDHQSLFVRYFGELRNKLVHDPSNIGFDLKGYLKALDSNQRDQWVKTLAPCIHEEIKVSALNGKLTRNHIVFDHPRLALLLATVSVVGSVLKQTEGQTIPSSFYVRFEYTPERG